jgi:hypothetical protein
MLVEGLEERTLLTTLYIPQNGAETASNGGGPLLGNVAPGMPLYTIYWGSYWSTAAGQSLQADIQGSLNPIFAESNFLSGLNQYGVTQPAYQPSVGVYEVNNGSDPPSNFTSSQIQGVISDAISNQGLPDSNASSNKGLYVIFTPPGTSSGLTGGGGYHSFYTGNSHVRDFAWIGDPNSSGLYDYTSNLSHEVEEAMTDPHGDAWQILPRSSSAWNEICDNEAPNYTEYLNGYEVESHWSQSNGDYAIDDGNSQTIYLTGGNMYVDGDQLGTGYNDTVTLDLNAQGGVQVTLNGQTFSYPYGQVNHIDVYTGGGSNTVNVRNTSSATGVTIDSGGPDNVEIGNPSDGVQGISGSVDVENTANYTNLTIDDTANSSSYRNVVATDISVFGLAPAQITFDPNILNSLTIAAGSAGNYFQVDDTPSNSIGVATTIGNYSGGGSDTIYVIDTTGPLYLDGGAGFNTVYVGLSGWTGGINGSVDAFNSSSSGYTSLYVDDHSDTISQDADLYDGELTGFGNPAPISWTASSSPGGGVTSLTIYGGPDDTYNVVNTSNFYGETNLYTGSGTDDVYVDHTTGRLYVQGGGTTTLTGPNTTNTWNITGTNAGNIGGVVSFSSVQNLVGGTGSDTFKFSNGEGVTGTIAGGGGIDALSYAAYTTGVSVNLSTGTATGTGGVSGIANVTGSPANDTITGNSSANIINGDGGNDVLNGGGGGDDSIIVPPNQGAGTTVTGGPDTVSLAGPNVASTWILTGADSGTLNGIAFTQIARVFGGTANDTFKFLPGGHLGLTISGGGGTNTLDYSGDGSAPVAINLAAGTAPDIFGFNVATIESVVGGSGVNTLIGPNAASTWTISGANSGKVGTLRFSAIENLTGGSSTDTFKFTSAGSVSGTVNGGAGTNTLDYSGDGGAAATVNLATATATGTGGFANIGKFVGSSSSADTLIGPNSSTSTIWKITGTNAGTVGSFAFSAVENLTGGTGVDEFVFLAGKTVSGEIDGGSADNWLDYTAYTTAVTVNLATGTATGVDRGAAGGITDIRNVRGGSGGNALTGDAQGNILIGGKGADTIEGGSGRSILIGDKGNDMVTGGSADDIVIGGYTSYDTSGDANDLALEAILGEWQSSDSYTTRIAQIRAGVGTMLAKFVWGTTVHDDGGTNTLTGGAGMDWFFQGAHDTITDQQSGEQIN